MNKLLICIIVILSIYGCNTNGGFNRQVLDLNTEVFYGIDKHENKESLIFLFTQDLNKAFSLTPINESPAENEIRVYYLYSFGQIFFRQQFKQGHTNAELYICSGYKRNDSMFMQQKVVIKTQGKYKYDNSMDFNNLSKYTMKIGGQDETILDNISEYFIQI